MGRNGIFSSIVQDIKRNPGIYTFVILLICAIYGTAWYEHKERRGVASEVCKYPVDADVQGFREKCYAVSEVEECECKLRLLYCKKTTNKEK